jgi:Pyridoxamine 5'-phosphate oxidase
MSAILGLLMVVCFSAVGIALGVGGFTTEVEAALKTEKHIYVATRRVNGEWSTPAPVWFMYDGEAVYLTTAPSSHKAHRIRRGSPVRVWVDKKDGPFFEGDARFVKDPAVVERMAQAYAQKYWLAWLGLFRPRPGRIATGKTLVVKITPVASAS